MPKQAELGDDFPTTDGGAAAHPSRPDGFDERQQRLESAVESYEGCDTHQTVHSGRAWLCRAPPTISIDDLVAYIETYACPYDVWPPQPGTESVPDDPDWPPARKDHLVADAPSEAPVVCDPRRNEAWCPDCEGRVTISHRDGTTEFGHGNQEADCPHAQQGTGDPRGGQS